MHVTANRLVPDSIDLWADRAAEARARHASSAPDWLPAGRSTDRGLRAGAWLAMPLTGGGFGAAMLIEKPGKQHRVFADAVIMGMRRRWDRWPTLAEVNELRPEDGGIIGQTSMICVRDGRWRVLGYRENHDSLEWTWPVPWHRDEDRKDRGRIHLQIDPGAYVELEIDRGVLDLDPRASYTCAGSRSYGSFELDIARLLDRAMPTDTQWHRSSDAIVTPERVAAWQALNRAIYGALAEKLGDAIQTP